MEQSNVCQNICFAKSLNICFISQLSKVCKMWLTHSRRSFILAARGTERWRQKCPDGPDIKGRRWGQGRRKWRVICEWSSPLGLGLFTWSMSSATEPTVCCTHMCIPVLFMQCLTSVQIFQKGCLSDPRKWQNQCTMCVCERETHTQSFHTPISICLATVSSLEWLSPWGNATATSACLPLFHSITQSDTRRQVS